MKENQIANYEIDGDITRIQYSTGQKHSVSEISMVYEIVMKANGFYILVKLNEKNCDINLLVWCE